MPRFSLALLLLVAAASAPSASSCCWFRPSNDKKNYRSGETYSTVTSNKAELTQHGAELFISPMDTFDFLPSPGHAVKGMKEIEESFSELAASRNSEIHDGAIVKGSDDDIDKWAQAQLGSEMQKYQVPRPNESLSGKILAVESVREILTSKDIGDVVVCHKIEQDATFCHKLEHENFGVTEVTVSPNGKPSALWVGCHEPMDAGGDDAQHVCHVLNVGDLVFTTPATTDMITTVGKFRSKGLKDDDAGILTLLAETHVMQSHEGTRDELATLDQLAHTQSTYHPHFIVSLLIDDTDDKLIHNPDSPVRILKHDENFDPDTVLRNAKDEVIGIEFIIPADHVDGLEEIVDTETSLLKSTMDWVKPTNPSGLRKYNKLGDYTNGPCKDMIIEFSSGMPEVDAADAKNY